MLNNNRQGENNITEHSILKESIKINSHNKMDIAASRNEINSHNSHNNDDNNTNNYKN